MTKAFHWVTAVLVLAMFPLGYVASDLAEAIRAGYQTDPEEIQRAVLLFSLHKTTGVAIFFIALARIGWAMCQPRPGLLNAADRLEAFAAEAVHWSLYVALVVVPAAGWIEHAASAGFAPIWWSFGQTLPLVPKSEAVAEVAGTLHVLFQYLFLASVALHILGALKHHIVDRDLTLRRMLPGTTIAPAVAKHTANFPSLFVVIVVWAGVTGFGFLSHEGGARNAEQATPTASAASDWVVSDGQLGIEIRQLGNVVEGRFDSWSAAIEFEERSEPGSAGSVEVGISIESLVLGSVTEQAKGADFFDIANFPTSRFVADIERTTSGYEARGTLFLKGHEIEVVLPFEIDLEGNMAWASGTLDLDRRDFGIGGAVTDETTLAFNVRVQFGLVAERKTGAEA